MAVNDQFVLDIAQIHPLPALKPMEVKSQINLWVAFRLEGMHMPRGLLELLCLWWVPCAYCKHSSRLLVEAIHLPVTCGLR